MARRGEKPQFSHNGGQAKLSSNAAEEFQTDGCWWVDVSTMKFYLDGKYTVTLHPPTKFGEAPFDHPLFMNLVCETYAWEAVPSNQPLEDDSRNTTFFDYVRSFKLEKK